MRIRTYLSVLIICAAIILLKWVYDSSTNLPKEDIYLNLSTELIGILITTILIDWLLERKKNKEETTKIAWNCLNKLRYASWIWLGSSRDQNIKQMQNYLKLVNNDDEIAPTTQNLLIQIAITAEETLILSREITKKSIDLKKGLKQLVELKKLRDEDKSLKPSETAMLMTEAILHFSNIIKYGKDDHKDFPPIKKLSSPEKQEWRLFGEITS